MSNEITLVRGTYRQIFIQNIKIGGETPDLTNWSVFAQVREDVFSSANLFLDFSNHPDRLEIRNPSTEPEIVVTFDSEMTKKLKSGKAFVGVKIQDLNDAKIVHQVALIQLQVDDTTTVVS